MKVDLFSEPTLWLVGGFPFTRTMLTSALMSALMLVAGHLISRAVSNAPAGRMAALGRISYRFLTDLVTQAAGQPVPGLEVFGGTLFIFIAGASLLGQLPGVSAPTSNLAAASALATLVLVAVPYAGIRKLGVRGYLRHYLRPNPILFPLHIISELSRTLALSLRLFGNMMSGHLIVALLVALVGVIVPVPLMALDLLIGLLQAYIFTILACVYVGAAAREGEQ